MVPERSSQHDPFASLATRLSGGPLQDLLDLQAKTTALARECRVDEARQLQQLTELVYSAQLALERLQIFTIELKVLVLELGQRVASRNPH